MKLLTRDQYDVMLKEIREDVEDGLLTESSEILVLRSDDPVEAPDGDGAVLPYYPIKDWYYDDLVSERDMAPDPTDDAEDAEEKRGYRDDFTRDRPRMRSMKVRDVIAELGGVGPFEPA